MANQTALATRPQQTSVQQRRDDGDNQLTAAALGAGATLERVQTSYCTAIRVQVKRDVRAVEAQAMSEAKLMGDSFFYAWTVKDKKRGRAGVEGLSTDGAKVLQRIWGNNAVDVQVIDESDTHWTFRATFIDLESGVTIPRLFKQRKPRSAKGDFDLDRFEDMEFQMGQSKAIRNVIKDALPKWLVDRCIEAAKDCARITAAKDPAAEKEEIIERATAIGLTGGRLARKMGKLVKDYSPEDIVTAKALITTVEQGHAPLAVIFPTAEAKAATKTNVEAFDADESVGEVEDEADELPEDEPEQSDSPSAPSAIFTRYSSSIAEAGKRDAENDLLTIGQEIGASAEKNELSAVEVAELKTIWKRVMDGVWKRTRAPE